MFTVQRGDGQGNCTEWLCNRRGGIFKSEGYTPRRDTIRITVDGIEQMCSGNLELPASLLQAFILLRRRLRQYGRAQQHRLEQNEQQVFAHSENTDEWLVLSCPGTCGKPAGTEPVENATGYVISQWTRSERQKFP